MVKGRGTYKSEKRKKELLRLKKQQEKRQRRFQKDLATKDEEATNLLKEDENSSQVPEG